MKIFAFSDWRIQSLELIIDALTIHNPDLILYAGDDLDRFIKPDKTLLFKTKNHTHELNYPDLEPIHNERLFLTQKLKKEIRREIDSSQSTTLQKLGIPCHYVNGNDDYLLYRNGAYYTRTIKNYDIFTLEDSSEDGGIYVPFSPAFGMSTVKQNNDVISIFGYECTFGLKSDIKNTPSGYADIYLSHIPPLGKLDLSVRFGLSHIGSKKLLRNILRYQPKMVICGHSHLWGGFLSKIGNTVILNVSSHDTNPSYGNYAIIDTNTWSVEMKTTSKEATARSLRGLGSIRINLQKRRKICQNQRKYSEITTYMRKLSSWRYGGLTRKELDEVLQEIEKKFTINTKRVRERVESFTWDNPKIIKKISINPDEEVFVDVETGLAKGLIPGELWLIGLWCNGSVIQFILPHEKKKFLDFLKDNQITTLVSWTRYDRDTLVPVLKKAKIKLKFVDACQRASNCITWHTSSLPKLYSIMFPHKGNTLDPIPGYIAGLYADHTIIPKKSCHHCPSKKSLMTQIKEKNKMDILRMIEICKRLQNIGQG